MDNQRVAPGKLGSRLTLQWRFKTGGPVLSSPVVSGGTVFVGSNDGFVYALRKTDGKKLWGFDTGKSVEIGRAHV